MKNQMYTMEASCKNIFGITRKYVVIATENTHSEMQKCWNHFVNFNCDPNRMHYQGVVILEEEVYNKTFKNLFEEVKEMMKVCGPMMKETKQKEIESQVRDIIANNKVWSLSDNDTFQWQRRIDKDAFELMEYYHDPHSEKYVWVKNTIYLYSDWLDNGEDMLTETVNILSQYGYTSQFALCDFDYDENKFNKAVINGMKDEFPEDWENIIAECIFEDYIFSSDWKYEYDTEEECKMAMLDWVKKHS